MNDRLSRLIFFVALLIGGFGAPSGAAPAPAMAKQETVAKAFDVMDVALHANAPRVEICLALSQNIDVKDRNRILSFLELKKDGKKARIAATDLSLTAQDICIQNLEHRHTYSVTLQRLQSVSGERLSKKYTATIEVPDRKPVLTFVGDSRRLILPRHVREAEDKTSDSELVRAGMAHVVRSVNVMATHLTLYKIADRKLFAEAWQQFKQMNLSPSESLYFSRQKGQVVFESDLVFGEAPNEDQTLVAPLPPEKELSPGLYYLAAKPRGKDGTNPGLFAGQWFLVSDLRIGATRLRDGIKFLAMQGGDVLTVVPDVKVAALDKDGEVLAEAKTGADGAVFVPLSPKNLEQVAVVTGQKESGDVDLFEIGVDRTVTTRDISLNAQLTLDQTVYRPGQAVVATLRAENAKGEVQDVGESFVQIIGPDYRIFVEKTLPAGKKGLSVVSLSLPRGETPRTWSVVWRRKDGALLASAPLTIMPLGAQPNVSLTLDRASLDLDQPTTIVVKAQDAAKKPLAFQNGDLYIKTARPEISGWSSFRFGDMTAKSGSDVHKARFTTDADGVARVIVASNTVSGVEALSFEAVLDRGGSTPPLTVPVRPHGDVLVGLKSQLEGRAIPENSVAQFDVIAVDMAGKRRALGDLYYLVYEEGRSFEWVQSEGHWDYRQRPDHRRVGGGPLSIVANGENTIRWPVTAGHYVLEVTNAAGDVLSRYDFDVGRRDDVVLRQDEMRLRFVDADKPLEMKTANRLKIFVGEPAMVSVLVTDGTVRQAFSRFMKAGMNEVEIAPSEGWGHQVLVRVVAQMTRSFEPVVAQKNFSVHALANDLSVKIQGVALTTGKTVSLPVQVQKQQRGVATFVSVIATPKTTQGGLLPVLVQEKSVVAADGKVDVPLALPEFDGTLELSITAWNDAQKGTSKTTLPAHPVFGVEGTLPEYVNVGDKISERLFLTNYAAQPLTVGYEWHLPDGVTSSVASNGKIRLAKGERQALPVNLSVRGSVAADMMLTLQGIGGASTARTWSWPLYATGEQKKAREEQAQNVDPNKEFDVALGKDKGGIFLIAPVTMDGVFSALETLTHVLPQTTVDVAQWIETSDAWAAVLHQTGLMDGKRLAALRALHVATLLGRQNEDGGFPVKDTGTPSDLASTAAALRVLGTLSGPDVPFAVQWLSLRLQNTWFDENERTARALAYDALASLNRVDISGLRYFSETSQTKTTEPVAMAALARALALVGDEAAAKAWIEKAKAQITSWQPLSYIATNDKISFEDASHLLSKMPEGKGLSFQDALRKLSSLAAIAQKAGTWRIQQGKEEHKYYGVYGQKIDPASSALKNMSERKLFVTVSPVSQK